LNYYIISFFITALISLLIAIFVLSRNPKSKLNITFSLFAFSVFVWSFFYLFFALSATNLQALFWDRCLMAGAIIIPAAFMHFILVHLEQDTKYKGFIYLNYLICLSFLAILPTQLFIKGITPLFGFRYWPDPGVLFHPYFAWFALNTIIAHLLMIRYLRASQSEKKNQIKYIFAGTLIGFIGGSTNFFMWYQIPIPPIGSPLVAMYVITIAYAITKHELMDIKLAITRTAAYGIVGLLLAGSFAALNSLAMPISLAMTANGGLALFWAWAAHRLREIIQTPLEEKWITGWYDKNKLLNRITQRLIPVMEKEDVFSIIAEELKSTIRISRIDVETENLESGYADVAKNKNNVVIPLSSSSGPEGKIILGPKTSEDAYNDRDLTLFRSIRLQAVAIFDRIRPYETIKKEFEANEKKLYETEKQLERSARLASLGTLTAGVAHEIRNPMSVLRSKAQKLENKLEDKAFLKEYAALSIKHIDRILNIIKGMLDQSKSHEAETKPININTLIEESLAYFAITKINVVKNFSDCPQIQGDPIRLSQVFINLIQNAIRAMPEGGTLTISTAPENGEIIIKVADTGKGIAAENLEKIFNPFFTTWNEGVGLGLSTTHRIIADYKGRIEVKSQEDKGTTFTIYLPVKK